MMSYHLRLQIGIHLWVLIHQVMNLYAINTNQSGPPMSARHKFQPRQLRSNTNSKPHTFPKKPTRQKLTGPIYFGVSFHFFSAILMNHLGVFLCGLLDMIAPLEFVLLLHHLFHCSQLTTTQVFVF